MGYVVLALAAAQQNTSPPFEATENQNIMAKPRELAFWVAPDSANGPSPVQIVQPTVATVLANRDEQPSTLVGTIERTGMAKQYPDQAPLTFRDLPIPWLSIINYILNQLGFDIIGDIIRFIRNAFRNQTMAHKLALVKPVQQLYSTVMAWYKKQSKASLAKIKPTKPTAEQQKHINGFRAALQKWEKEMAAPTKKEI